MPFAKEAFELISLLRHSSFAIPPPLLVGGITLEISRSLRIIVVTRESTVIFEGVEDLEPLKPTQVLNKELRVC